MSFTSTGIPRSSGKNSRNASLVTDSKIEAVTGGVITFPLRTVMRQAPVASLTKPRLSRNMASSKPSLAASLPASPELA